MLDGGGFGEFLDGFDDSFGGEVADEFAAGELGDLGEDVEADGLAAFFFGGALDGDGGVEGFAGVGAAEADLVIAGFGGGEGGGEEAPGFLARSGEAEGGGFAGGGGDLGDDDAFAQGFAGHGDDVGVEGDAAAGAGAVGGVEEADFFAARHVALVGHPADDLAPEAVVVFVFDAATPAPGAVGSHEEDFAGAEGFGDDEGDATEAVGLGAVGGEDFAAGFGAEGGAVPLEAGEGGPDAGGGVFGVFEFGEEAAGAGFGEDEAAGGFGTEASGLGVVPDDGKELVERGLPEGGLGAA